MKTNIGHLDTAAGIAGLIKTALALEHEEIPPSLHFESLNPKIDFNGSRFYVNTELTRWERGPAPRRAGVSSFGIGGTNAHVILEEAPQVQSSESARPGQLLVLSARTPSALETATANLAAFLRDNPSLNLADVAHTLQVGRQKFSHRRMVVCRGVEDAAHALTSLAPGKVFTGTASGGVGEVVFMFSGQGSQYVNMGLELYSTEPVFREFLDTCADLLRPQIELDIREVLYPTGGLTDAATERLKQTYSTQVSLFVIECALAKLWMKWGVRPDAMIGVLANTRRRARPCRRAHA